MVVLNAILRKLIMMVYCDKIADTVRKALLKYDSDGIIGPVEGIKSDLHPKGGWFVSPKKTIELYDMNGKKYVITIEEKLNANDNS